MVFSAGFDDFFFGGGEKLHVTSCGLLSRIAHVGVSENVNPLDPPGMAIEKWES